MLTLLYLSSYCSVQQRLLQFRSDPPSLNMRLLSQQTGNSPLLWQLVICAALKPSILCVLFCFFLDLNIDLFFYFFNWNSHTY